MKVDLSVKVTPEVIKEMSTHKENVSFDHVGTHFDAMDKEFPLDFTERKGVVFNVRDASGRDICSEDIDMDRIDEGMFVALYSSFIEKVRYGSKEYFSTHPELTDELIDKLLDKKISIIGLDFAGIKHDPEHPLKDQYCADRGAFVVENLINLDKIIGQAKAEEFIAHTYPINFTGITGLPCRVIGEI